MGFNTQGSDFLNVVFFTSEPVDVWVTPDGQLLFVINVTVTAPVIGGLVWSFDFLVDEKGTVVEVLAPGSTSFQSTPEVLTNFCPPGFNTPIPNFFTLVRTATVTCSPASGVNFAGPLVGPNTPSSGEARYWGHLVAVFDAKVDAATKKVVVPAVAVRFVGLGVGYGILKNSAAVIVQKVFPAVTGFNSLRTQGTARHAMYFRQQSNIFADYITNIIQPALDTLQLAQFSAEASIILAVGTDPSQEVITDGSKVPQFLLLRSDFIYAPRDADPVLDLPVDQYFALGLDLSAPKPFNQQNPRKNAALASRAALFKLPKTFPTTFTVIDVLAEDGKLLAVDYQIVGSP